ncbi:MAG: hypothetical protein IJW36_01420 [Clostridia bacterium]|nr:hypothetical protein [Clostridia bacterium]
MKKFSAILICLLMIITCGLAGCASFSINKVKYYNEVLATVDETKITRFDLLSAYNSYGNSYYVQQQGKSEDEALKSTLDLLIDRELMYQYALDNDALYKPTAYQVNEVVKEMFNSLDEQMSEYIEEAKNILGIEIEDSEEDNESEEKAYKIEDYTYSPRAQVKSRNNNGTTEYYIEYIVEAEEENYEKLIDAQYLTNFTANNAVNEIKTKYFEHFLSDLNDKEASNTTAIYNKVRSLFAKDLISYEYYLRDENGKKYDTATENLLNRYFERTFKSQIQSQYLENIRTEYLKNEVLSISLLEQEYAYLSTLNYNKYNNNLDAYKDAMKDIGTDGDSILYHPETDTQFGYFIHTLISFDSIKDNLKLLEEEKDQEAYELEYNRLISSVGVKARNPETGLVDENTTETNISDILKEYNEIKNNYSNYEERMSAFIQFMFKYTGDTATLSSGMPYVVGTNGYSAMVEEFNNEAINLMQGEKGNMSNATLSDLDSLCITEYGIHLLFYVGDVNSFDIPYTNTDNIYIQDEDITDSEMFNLYTKIINPLTKETYFDMMFDLVYPASSGEVFSSNNGYTDFEEEITNASENKHPVTKYTTKINATKTSL